MEKDMQGTRATEEWTNEKHNMYIKSIEASFVNELYDSKQMRDSFSSKGNSYESTTGQFKVLRGGFWQKISFEREQKLKPQKMSKVNKSLGITANPWIQHYRSSSNKHQTNQLVNLNQRNQFSKSSSSSGQLDHCDQDMLCDDTEVSDQNFIDDEEEVKSEEENKLQNKGNAKRQKSHDN